MSTITKEWLQRKITEFKSWREDIPFGLDEDDHNMLIALEIALASLEAEPVAWMHANNPIGITASLQAGHYGLSVEHYTLQADEA
ncbi:hypothetical protein [Escherichia coli]|uniref:hypothetical protein n=1 Tax=Escherichia coli TaxID=562 RepID=UPI001F28E486|nr:hypothetical protein [Escherichia coli]